MRPCHKQAISSIKTNSSNINNKIWIYYFYSEDSNYKLTITAPISKILTIPNIIYVA